MAAAWQLSQQPGYEIHVYEKSWRLGGKGASVRDGDGRILDHGLHVWLGFYENAFRMMRECYAEVEQHKWGPDQKPADRLAHSRIDDAFFPEPHIGVASHPASSDWAAWSGYFPPAKGLPGTPLDEGTNPFTLANYLLRCFDLLKTLMLSVIGPPADDVPGRPRPEKRSAHDEAANLDFSGDSTRSVQLLIDRMTQLLRAGSLTGAAVLLQTVTILERGLQKLDDFTPQAANSTLKLIEALAAQTRKLLNDFASIDPKIRMKTEIIDIVLTIMVGLFRDRVLFDDKGLDVINGYEYRAWLTQHGATRTSVKSSFLTGIYDLVFAYRRGDPTRPALAAGVAIRGALRMLFTYRGAMFWRIRSGMGDAVFAPFYKVLLEGRKVKGKDGKSTDASTVQFHFLHELEEVAFKAPEKGSRYVSSLKFKTHGDWSKLDACSRAALDDFGCWPDTPVRFEEALKAGIGTRELHVETDFDGVIFAMGIDEFKKACIDEAHFENADAKLPAQWTAMCAQVKTVATKSAQVWLDKDLQGLGWYRGSGIFTALGRSFDTWADMTHTLATERAWRALKEGKASKFAEARSVAYFCATMPESVIKAARAIAQNVAKQKSAPLALIEEIAVRTGIHVDDDLRASIAPKLDELLSDLGPAPSSSAARKEFVNQLTKNLLKAKVDSDLTEMLIKDLKPIWPTALSGGSAKSFEIGRYVQANFEGSDRYTLSLPGSLVYRISPLDRSVENMTIAGDWTACGLDTGCVEAAVMSGILAAHAISGTPDLESIIGYDHP
jgi:uncharacterized protein with NAD-binding domain and iron-sulfur cluster